MVDLDAHAIQPDNEEIYYCTHMNNPTSMSGVLDVDDIRPQGTGVENIIWTDPEKMSDGTYTLLLGIMMAVEIMGPKLRWLLMVGHGTTRLISLSEEKKIFQ